MRISRLLQGKGTDVATVAPDASVADVLETLTERNIGALVVSTDGRTIDGIVSERDIVRALHQRGAGILDETVTSLMTTEVRTCDPGATTDELSALMTELRVRHVPVVVDGALAGIVSIGDVVKSRLGELEQDNRALVEYIQTGR